MKHRAWNRLAAAAAALIVSTVVEEAPVAAGTETTASIVVEVAGTHYEGNGVAECRSAPDGSIYDVPASMWHASFADNGNPLSRVNVTLWQPAKGGPAQLTLLVAARSETYEIVTVPAGRTRGSATGRVERLGSGGTLIVEGTTAMQQRIRVRVSCSQFLPAEDNG